MEGEGGPPPSTPPVKEFAPTVPPALVSAAVMSDEESPLPVVVPGAPMLTFSPAADSALPELVAPPVLAAPPAVLPPPTMALVDAADVPPVATAATAVGRGLVSVKPPLGEIIIEMPLNDKLPPVAPAAAGDEVPMELAAIGTPVGEIAGGRPPVLTMMLPYCSGNSSRPSVSTGSSRDWSGLIGGWPMRPAAASRFWSWIAPATSDAVILRAAIFCGSNQALML